MPEGGEEKGDCQGSRGGYVCGERGLLVDAGEWSCISRARYVIESRGAGKRGASRWVGGGPRRGTGSEHRQGPAGGSNPVRVRDCVGGGG